MSLLCERCGNETAFYELFGENLCDFCLIMRRTEIAGPDYSDHISFPVRRITQTERVVEARSKLTNTGLTRTLIDMSPVSGSNMFVYVCDEEVTYKKFELKLKPLLKAGPFDDPRFVLCRPLFKEEKAVEKRGLLYPISGKKESDMTDTLDVFFTFLSYLNDEKEICEATGKKYSFERFLARIIGHQYYDCMHSGMNQKLISLCKTLVFRLRPSLQAKIYPDGDTGWHTLGDWMMEVQCVPEVNLNALPDNVVKALTE